MSNCLNCILSSSLDLKKEKHTLSSIQCNLDVDNKQSKMHFHFYTTLKLHRLSLTLSFKSHSYVSIYIETSHNISKLLYSN